MRVKTLGLTAVAASAVFIGASTASADTLANYNFNSFANNIGNPSTPDTAASGLVTASNLDRDPGGTGNTDGLGTVTATQTRHNIDPGGAPATFADTALAIGVGTTARNPFADPPDSLTPDQDYMTFSLTSNSDSLVLTDFSFDYAASVRDTDGTDLFSAAQLFYSVNGGAFSAIGGLHQRSVVGSDDTFTGFSVSSVDLSSIGTLGIGDVVDFRLSFGDNSGAGTAQKAVYIDNLIVSGAIPEPASMGLLGLAGVGLLARRRR